MHVKAPYLVKNNLVNVNYGVPHNYISVLVYKSSGIFSELQLFVRRHRQGIILQNVQALFRYFCAHVYMQSENFHRCLNPTSPPGYACTICVMCMFYIIHIFV